MRSWLNKKDKFTSLNCWRIHIDVLKNHCLLFTDIQFIIDFAINGLSMENRPLSQRTPRSYKINVNLRICWSDRVNSSNFNTMTLKFSNIFDHKFSHVFILVTCLLRVAVSLLGWFQAASKIHVPIYPYLISEGRRNCSTLYPAQQRNSDSQETGYQI